ncbi:MAG: hypothetical protein IH944_06905 [Armatimonadetes bacterium]|nr:hypothetical protein [Armatimonadota bacterium]
MIAAFALVLAQTPKNVPADAELVYPLMPRLTAVANEDGEKVRTHMTLHSMTVKLGKDFSSFESLSLFKNTAKVEGEVDLVVAFEAYRSGFGQNIPVIALWSDDEVLPVDLKTRYALPEKGQIGLYEFTYRVTVKRLATHSLRLKFSLPVGKSGIDREERLIGYRVMDIDQRQALEQFRMSVKYDGEIVFVPIEAKPDWGWEVGANGAYLKLDRKKSDRDAILTYRYYPAGFGERTKVRP